MVEKHIVLTYKSGHECSHSPVATTEDEWWTLVAEILAEFQKDTPGTLLLNRPYGAHRLSEVASVHFGDSNAPPDKPQMGFIVN